MKKLIVLLIALAIGGSLYAQTYRYRATYFAIGERSSYNGRVIWGDWQRCGVVITIDLDNEFINVYSSKTQNYVIAECGETYTDSQGGQSLDMVAIDEEGLRCTVSLRTQSDGVAQLYAYYSDVAWVYSNLRRY